MDERFPDDEEELKPDIKESADEKEIPAEDAIHRELDTYGESDLDPNRQDEQDAHHAGPDEHV